MYPYEIEVRLMKGAVAAATQPMDPVGPFGHAPIARMPQRAQSRLYNLQPPAKSGKGLVPRLTACG
jgi:hypothetical protein